MKKLMPYGLLSLCLFLFQMVYHHFSHGVVSFSLQYAWLFLAAGGVIWRLIAESFHPHPLCLQGNLYHSGLACLITWCLLNGVLEIAGSDSPYLWLYLLFGGGFILASLVTLGIKQKNIV